MVFPSTIPCWGDELSKSRRAYSVWWRQSHTRVHDNNIRNERPGSQIRTSIRIASLEGCNCKACVMGKIIPDTLYDAKDCRQMLLERGDGPSDKFMEGLL